MTALLLRAKRFVIKMLTYTVVFFFFQNSRISAFQNSRISGQISVQNLFFEDFTDVCDVSAC